jgi:hypothetical protein
MIDAAEVSVVQPCAAISKVMVEDARAAGPVGRRFLKVQPRVAQPVSLRGDAAAWARTGIEEIFRQARLATGGAGKPALRIKVEQIVTEETGYRRAEYDAPVILLAEVASASGGPPAGPTGWTASPRTTATRAIR